MTANFGHQVAIEVDQVCGVHRYRASCRSCTWMSGWHTTAAPWPDAPMRPAHEAQAHALSAAQVHLRGRLQVLPTQGPVPSWERASADRPPSAGKVAYSVTAEDRA